MEFKDVLAHRNVDNKIYICDVSRWLKDKVPLKTVREVRDKIMEIYGQDN